MLNLQGKFKIFKGFALTKFVNILLEVFSLFNLGQLNINFRKEIRMIIHTKMNSIQGIFRQSRGQHFMLLQPGAVVFQSLVGGLKCHKPCGIAKLKKKKSTIYKQNTTHVEINTFILENQYYQPQSPTSPNVHQQLSG